MSVEKLFGPAHIASHSIPDKVKLNSLRHLMVQVEQGITGRHPGQGVQLDRERQSSPDWQIGIPKIDNTMPGAKMNADGVHEIGGKTIRDAPAASAYIFALLKQLLDAVGTKTDAPILWCQSVRSQHEFGVIHGAGLKAFGLNPQHILLVRASRNQDMLWAMEEGARSANLLAVVGEVDAVSFTEARRLSLAAKAGGTPIILLRASNDFSISATDTRWRVAAALGTADPFVKNVPGNPRWEIELVRCRGGKTGKWTVEWCDEAYRFSLAEKFFSESSQPAKAHHNTGQVHILPKKSAFG